MKINPKAYYNKHNGIIYFTTPFMDGVLIEPTREQDLEAYDYCIIGVDKNDIITVELDHDYLSQIGSHENYKINLKNLKLRFFDSKQYTRLVYGTQEEKLDYTFKELETMYYEHYKYNLKGILDNNTELSFKWMKLSDINVRQHMLNMSWEKFFTDPYLKDSADDRLKLGMDILKNGTFYPIVVSTSKRYNDKLYVFEGNHRILSLKLLQFEGIIPEDFRILTIYAPDDYFSYKRNYSHVPLKSPIMQRHPLETRYVGYAVNPKSKDILNKLIIEDEGVLIDSKNVQIPILTQQEFMDSTQIYPHWIRDIAFKFKEENLNLKPLDIINDFECFKDWVKEVNPELYYEQEKENFKLWLL